MEEVPGNVFRKWPSLSNVVKKFSSFSKFESEVVNFSLLSIRTLLISFVVEIFELNDVSVFKFRMCLCLIIDEFYEGICNVLALHDLQSHLLARVILFLS